MGNWRIGSIVGTGGAEICDFILNVEKQSYPLDGHLIKEIIEHFEDMDVNFAIPWEGILFSSKDDKHIQELAKADKVPYQVVDFNEFLKNLDLNLLLYVKLKQWKML